MTPTSSVMAPPPFVPPGEYQLAFRGHRTSNVFGAHKVAFYFRIVTPGPGFGAELARWYRIRKVLTDKRFVFGWHGELVREFAILFGARPSHADRFPISRFKDVLVVGRVETVTADHRQRPLPQPMAYSVIRELTRVDQ